MHKCTHRIFTTLCKGKETVSWDLIPNAEKIDDQKLVKVDRGSKSKPLDPNNSLNT